MSFAVVTSEEDENVLLKASAVLLMHQEGSYWKRREGAATRASVDKKQQQQQNSKILRPGMAGASSPGAVLCHGCRPAGSYGEPAYALLLFLRPVSLHSDPMTPVQAGRRR